MSNQSIYNLYGEGGKTLYQGNDSGDYQTALGKRNATLQSNGSGGVPSIGGVQLPSWLTASPDDHMHELVQSYAGVQAAFDPTDQVNARNNAIGYNLAAGTQVANNAASEYANRATQQGGSTLGAGVVKAQAMLPVFQQNAALKSDAADVAAKAHQDAASLASQIASTIGNLRMSYLGTLTGFATDQQRLQTQNSQFNAQLSLDQQRLNLQQNQSYQAQQEADRQRQLATLQNSHRTTTPAKMPNYSVRPSGLGTGTNIGFSPEYMAANQQLGGLL